MPEEKELEIPAEELTCKNCNTEFVGNYCPNCGQASHNLNRPFHFVIYDFAGTIFSFDTRFFRSIKYLLISPGKIALDFVEGKRARYMAPFQMYVFVSFVFFFTLSVYTKTSLKPVYEEQLQIALRSNDSINNNLGSEIDSLGGVQINNLEDFNSEKLYLAKLEIDKRLRSSENLNKKEALILQKLSRLFSDPNLFFVAVFKYVSWGLFFLMPLFALLLLLFFGKKGYYYTAHLTMSLNLHTFLFLILILGLLVRIVFHSVPGLVVLILFLSFSVYEYIGLKKMYEKPHVRTFFFAGFMNFIYFMLFLLILTLIIAAAFFYS